MCFDRGSSSDRRRGVMVAIHGHRGAAQPVAGARGRSRPHQRVARAGRDGRGRLVVVEGPAGVGKTALLAEARAIAESSGMQVLRSRGAELEREFAFGVVRQLLEPVLRGVDDPEGLFQGPAGVAAGLLGLPGAPAHDGAAFADQDSSFAVLHGLYWLCADLAGAAATLRAGGRRALGRRPLPAIPELPRAAPRGAARRASGGGPAAGGARAGGAAGVARGRRGGVGRDPVAAHGGGGGRAAGAGAGSGARARVRRRLPPRDRRPAVPRAPGGGGPAGGRGRADRGGRPARGALRRPRAVGRWMLVRLDRLPPAAGAARPGPRRARDGGASHRPRRWRRCAPTMPRWRPTRSRRSASSPPAAARVRPPDDARGALRRAVAGRARAAPTGRPRGCCTTPARRPSGSPSTCWRPSRRATGGSWTASPRRGPRAAASGAPESAAVYLRRALAEPPPGDPRSACCSSAALAEANAGEPGWHEHLAGGDRRGAPTGRRAAAVALTTAQALLREQRPEEALGDRRRGRGTLGDGDERIRALLEAMAVASGTLDARLAPSVVAAASGPCAARPTATRPRPGRSWPSRRGRRRTATSPPRSLRRSRVARSRASPRPTARSRRPSLDLVLARHHRAGLGRALRRGAGAARRRRSPSAAPPAPGQPARPR